MQDLELFIKGLVKSFEDFYATMVSIGRESSGKSVELPKEREVRRSEKPTQSKKPVQREFAELEAKIVTALGGFPRGCTLKELANNLSVQWHFLRIPIRHLIEQKKIFKNDKIYSIRGKSEDVPVVSERPGAKRRIIDAKVLDTPVSEKAPSGVPEMSVREKEILKFKTLTAFRGRPEGLTIAELAAVLGRSPGGLEVILKELMADKKVAEGKGSKYHLS